MWQKFTDFRYWIADHMSFSVVRTLLLGLIVLVILYFVLGAVFIHRINDDPEFKPENYASQGNSSHAVTIAAALVDREVNRNSWISNDPFFYPSALLDNMAHYQQGIISVVARFSFDLKDQLGRTRGSSMEDPDLKNATSALQYAGDQWIWEPSISFFPVSSSEAQYRAGLAKLRAYNNKVADGSAVFERRTDNLQVTLERFAVDIGASSAIIDRHIREGFGCMFDIEADDVFYNVKGQAYAYYMILQGLRQDFDQIITDRELTNTWDEMEKSLLAIIALDPTVVSNCSPDAMFLPNHLAAQGFYLLRARTQLKELTNILQK
ncbi:DUF2333 family protein [Emcibacter nanhaiensis]|uniref:DUF2333 family protein n=1 Tax=Emcibacter nanhaiensis TaxID=1505037 RepID=A0A501PH31_9PROT|nr:DUF2333 family protein [Emcibacter nanhaiensis]TPD59773.1 DUF2333 family protein [Emcibacter nanhaiensis]